MTPRLHDDEVPADEATVRALLREQRPEWADLPLHAAGSGSDNTMYRLGPDLVVRLPRRPGTAGDVAKEHVWLPCLAPHLPVDVPRPVLRGEPTSAFPFPWSVYRWIEGAVVGGDTVDDWAQFGADLAGFVGALHATALQGAQREGALSWYRGGSLKDTAEWVGTSLEECRALEGLDLDVDRLEQAWLDALALPDPADPHVWLHGDLRPTNLLAREGRLHAVIDFGALSVGLPAAEHAVLWDYPVQARQTYRDALALDDVTWERARAWAIVVGVSGVAYYWHTYPAFVDECLARLRAILSDLSPAGHGPGPVGSLRPDTRWPAFRRRKDATTRAKWCSVAV